jgi:hypothetical protein
VCLRCAIIERPPLIVLKSERAVGKEDLRYMRISKRSKRKKVACSVLQTCQVADVSGSLSP